MQESLIIYKNNECVIGQIWLFTSQERGNYIFLKPVKVSLVVHYVFIIINRIGKINLIG